MKRVLNRDRLKSDANQTQLWVCSARSRRNLKIPTRGQVGRTLKMLAIVASWKASRAASAARIDATLVNRMLEAVTRVDCRCWA